MKRARCQGHGPISILSCALLCDRAVEASLVGLEGFAQDAILSTAAASHARLHAVLASLGLCRCGRAIEPPDAAVSATRLDLSHGQLAALLDRALKVVLIQIGESSGRVALGPSCVPSPGGLPRSLAAQEFQGCRRRDHFGNLHLDLSRLS